MQKVKRPADLGKLIIVGGPGGSGSSTIAKMLAHHFGLHYVYGGGLMRQYAEQNGFESLEAFMKSKLFQQHSQKFDKLIDEKLIRFAYQANVLIDSKDFAALATFRNIPTTAKIWVDAPVVVRARRTLHKTGKITLDKKLPRSSRVLQNQIRKLSKRYQADKKRFKNLYGIDYAHPEKYNDIVINSKGLNEGQTFNLIMAKLSNG
ncbi:MAG: AAA family ATPase [Candidatus Dojkabacteria bacterium]